MKEELKLIDIVYMLMRRWWIILISMVVAGSITFLFTEVFIAPEYESEGALYVNASKEQIGQSISATTITASQKLVNTYAEILKRRTFLEGVANDMNNEYTFKDLQSMISIMPANETEVMEIIVTSEDPYDSYKIAHNVLMRAPDELMKVVEAGSVKLLDDAKINDVAVSPNLRQNTLVGALIGVILGILIILLLEFIDTRIKDAESLASRYREPVLGEIPSLMDNKR